MTLQKDRHYSQDLERAMIGCVLIEKSAFGRVYGIVKPEIFYYDDHKVIWQEIEKMWENNLPIENLTVVLRMIKNGITELHEGNTPYYVTRCTREVVSTANLEYWGLILREMYIEREMITITHAGMKTETWAYMDELQEKITKLRQVKTTDDFKSMDELLHGLQTHMEHVKDKELVGITTGFRTLDKLTGGLVPGEMFIVGARPSVGKSAFLGRMVIAAAQQKNNVAVISLEMEDNRIMARISSLVSEIEFWRIYRNRMFDQQQSEQFYTSIASLKNLPIRISDTAQVDLNDIKAKVAKLKQRGQVDILFIDYLQLIEADEKPNKTREQEVSKLSRGLKVMAKDYGIPVVVLCQLNRMSESSKDKKPQLHNLRESGSLEQDAYGVIFLHRDFMSGILQNADGSSTENEADLIIAKWRDGVVTSYKIGFDGTRMKFYEIPGQQQLIPVKSLTNFHEPQKESFDEGFENDKGF